MHDVMEAGRNENSRSTRPSKQAENGLRADSGAGAPGMFPTVRPRRLRRHPLIRDLVRETSLTVSNLILPLFVRGGTGVRKEIASMPGNYQLSVDRLVDDIGAS